MNMNTYWMMNYIRKGIVLREQMKKLEKRNKFRRVLYLRA